jgi:SNF2 family DNA or RNA helicase
MGLVAKVGQVRDGAVRFAPAQALLLEAALGGAEIDVDAEYARVREGIQRFTAIEPAAPSVGFTGTLRPYQCEGLGWMRFLRDVGLGGCLADDMGLGKTVQVLAMLEARREERAAAAPRAGAARRVKSTKAASGPDSKPAAAASIASPRTSLVVAPRSLVFNWCAEAARFAPKLKVLDLSAPGRTIDAAEVAAHDLVLTTYGMLRNDFSQLREIEFDYLILDEAQAIKNASSQTAHAAKSLRGRHRLALSGTPVENHLGELWSLVEFLNPALLPRISERAGNALADPDAARVAAAAVRPFLLRRTKAQVAKDLPARIEKTITCQLGAVQRRIYDTLRNEVRASVQGRIKELGLGRAGVYVLEGLLRLRQAACHPGLVDAKWNGEPSAKLESLVPLLAELAAEGHKTLVFSQFTSFLDLVEPLVTAAGLRYERLDGSTRNRGERVERFQSDPSIPLFLISLKAGGLGLNLTSADHVVLLDPWWNPAVEAQAIDRAHRMGQHRTVIAARLVAADTVEARILELQARKRELADAIVGGERGPLSGLSREDLEHLLG